jgi:nucleoside-diphosphate-sugar epimerase
MGFHEKINIGYPETILTQFLAFKMCKILGIPESEHIELIDLPEMMTLRKVPSLKKQKHILGVEPKVTIDEGITRVLTKVWGDIYD